MPENYTVKVKPEKVDAVREIAERMGRAETVVLTEYRGLTVPELAELRSSLSEAEVEYKVVKNTLARIAAQDRGIEGIDELLEGPTAVAFCYGDPVIAAKALSGFADDHPALVIKGGILEGRVMSSDETKNLATIDSLEMSLGKIVGSLESGLRAMVSTLEGALRQIMFVLENFPADAAAAEPEAEAKAEEAEEPEAETPEAEEPEAETPEAEEPEAEAKAEEAEEPEAETPEAESEPAAEAEPEPEAEAEEPAEPEPEAKAEAPDAEEPAEAADEPSGSGDEPEDGDTEDTEDKNDSEGA